jgi:hypothetical protein
VHVFEFEESAPAAVERRTEDEVLEEQEADAV